MSTDEDLDGLTLKVYLTLVKQNKPLGPREVMRLAGLSSPSVSYRNLQKLDDLGLIEKDQYGQYFVKQRQNIKGYVWIGNKIFPRIFFYSFFYVGILAIEVFITIANVIVGEPIAQNFLLLLLITSISTAIFLFEGASALKSKRRVQKAQQSIP
jgi:hypothetical protein